MTDVPNNPNTRDWWTQWFYAQDPPEFLAELPLAARINLRFRAYQEFLQRLQEQGLLLEEVSDD